MEGKESGATDGWRGWKRTRRVAWRQNEGERGRKGNASCYEDGWGGEGKKIGENKGRDVETRRRRGREEGRAMQNVTRMGKRDENKDIREDKIEME